MTAIVDSQTGTATLVEGAEVVRTLAVSYATPILHHVFLQATPHAHTTTHTTLPHTTHTAASHQAPPPPRRPPTILSSATPIILQAARAAIKHDDTGRLVGLVGSSTCSTTTTTTTCGVSTVGAEPLHPRPHAHVAPSSSAMAAASSSPSVSPPPSLSPPSSSSSSSSSSCSALGSSCGSRTDDELTSLSWLQDSNLLRGTALSPVKTSQGTAEVSKAESPTSDYGEESSDALEPGELTLNDQPHTQPSRSQPIPYNPQVHVNAKPPYSFSCLIFMAIEDSANKALPVKDIYAWILDHFPYFRNAPTGWKNSVRHNLSLNKCFRKVEKAPNLGKGSLWMVDPAYRPNLLQALSKTPFHPYSNLDRIYMVSTKAAYNNRHLVETVGGPGNVSRTATSAEAAAVSPSKPAGANVPDPELFPYLAKRLGSSASGGLNSTTNSGLGSASAGVQSEDVDAAAAMLALKHGPRILTPASESYSKLRDGKDTSVLYEENRKRKRKRKHTEVGDARMMVISSSPSEDHSYTSMDGDGVEEEYSSGQPLQATPVASAATFDQPPPPKKANHSPTSSVDEAFSDDSYDSDEASEASQADIRQLVEGADALLNLAAVATSLASQRSISGSTPHSHSQRHYQSSAQRLSHRNYQASNSSRPRKVHVMKADAGKSSQQKSSHKSKMEVPHNNNTIINNNNKVLKMRRVTGSAQGRGSTRHQLPASR